MNTIYYYKVIDENDNILGVGTSLNLRYYNEKTNRLVHEFESLAQYICVNETIYRVEMLPNEHSSQKGKYPTARMRIISEENYNKLKKIYNS